MSDDDDNWLAELREVDLSIPHRFERVSFADTADGMPDAARRLVAAAERIERCLTMLSEMMASSASGSTKSGIGSGATSESAGESRATTAAIERARRHARTSAK